MHSPLDWLGPASSVATVVALIVTLLYYLYKWPFHLKTPAGLKAEHNSGQVRLRWQPVHRASGYSIYRTEVGDGVTDIFSCAKHFYDDAAPASGKVYQYYVVAEDQGHQSSQSDVVSVTVKGVIIALEDDSPEAQWPVKDLAQVFEELQKRENKAVLAILDMTASKPDTLVLFSDVCQRAGVSGRQGSAAIGALTTLIKRLGKTKWPFTHHPSQTGQCYKLSPEMAKRWRQVEAEGKNV